MTVLEFSKAPVVEAPETIFHIAYHAKSGECFLSDQNYGDREAALNRLATDAANNPGERFTVVEYRRV